MVLEDGGGEAVALGVGSGAAALGGSVEQWLKMVVAVLGGGSGRRTCEDGIGVRVAKAKELLL